MQQADKAIKVRASADGVKVLLISALAFVLAYFYERSALHQFVETRVSLPYLFQTRDMLGLSPDLHPRLKILVYDDQTFSALKAAEMGLEQWVGLLEAIDARRPKLIFIDQIFGMTPRVRHAADAAALLERLGRLRTPLVTAAFISEQRISYRAPLDLKDRQYQLRAFFRDDRAMMLSAFPTMTQRLGWTAYGPNQELSPFFHHVGHVLNSGLGYAAALLQPSGDTVLPHMCLLGGDRFMIDHGKLVLDGVRIPIDRHGQMVVDFSSPGAYRRHARRLLPLLQAADAGKTVESGVEAGDMVLILPALFTGNTDFAETPFGQLPGGYVIASLLSSRLRQDWIRPIDALDGPVYAGIALGAVASLAPGYLFLPALVALTGLWFGACTLLFSVVHVCPSVSAPFLSMLTTALMIQVERYRLRERVVVLMRLLSKENEVLQSELNQAGEISRAFIPAKVPKWPGFTIGVFHRPLSSASGDWYAFERSLSARFLHFLMCDISGHGAQAAIIVSTCKTVLSMLVASNPEALESDQFIAYYARMLNDTLCMNGSGHHTTTFLGLTFEVVEGRVHCICAGHPRPIHLKRNYQQKPAFLGAPSTLLGIMPARPFTPRSYQIDPGDNVLAYTDGVPFPRSLTRVVSIFEKYRHLDPDSGAKYMAVEARERQQDTGRLYEDDISLVWFRWGTSDERQRDAGSGAA